MQRFCIFSVYLGKKTYICILIIEKENGYYNDNQTFCPCHTFYIM